MGGRGENKRVSKYIRIHKLTLYKPAVVRVKLNPSLPHRWQGPSSLSHPLPADSQSAYPQEAGVGNEARTRPRSCDIGHGHANWHLKNKAKISLQKVFFKKKKNLSYSCGLLSTFAEFQKQKQNFKIPYKTISNAVTCYHRHFSLVILLFLLPFIFGEKNTMTHETNYKLVTKNLDLQDWCENLHIQFRFSEDFK